MAYSDMVYRPPREDYLSPVNPNDSRFIRPPREDYLSPVNPNDSRRGSHFFQRTRGVI